MTTTETTEEATTLRERVRAASELLESIDKDRGQLAQLTAEERQRFLHATRIVSDPDPRARRRLVKASARLRKAALAQEAEEMFASTGIRELRRKPVFTTPNYYRLESGVEEPSVLPESRHCYVCKVHFQTVHHFYDQLCPACAELNFAKRTESVDLTGRVALLTGGRVKIGYQAGLKLLRAGAHLIVTTRFPRDSAARYAAEPDFATWSDRLEIFGLDLRHTPSVEAFCHELLTTRTRLEWYLDSLSGRLRVPLGHGMSRLAGGGRTRHATLTASA